jgi:hypothetical protein
MTSSPHCNVVGGFEALTSVSASLQYHDVQARGLVETCVDGRLSPLNLHWRQIPDSNKCDSAIYFSGLCNLLELSLSCQHFQPTSYDFRIGTGISIYFKSLLALFSSYSGKQLLYSRFVSTHYSLYHISLMANLDFICENLERI